MHDLTPDIPSNIHLRSIPLTMTGCSAPGASMRACRGMFYAYYINLIMGSYIFMGCPLCPRLMAKSIKT